MEPAPPDYNVTDPIFDWAARAPQAPAVIDGDDTVDYRTLCAAAGCATRQFHAAGWRSGDVVGVSFRGSPAQHLAATIALARAGLTQVTLAPHDPPQLRRSIAQSLGVTALVSDHDDPSPPVVAALKAADWLSMARDGLAPKDVRAAGGNRVWTLIQTSGTTGTPKTIPISHDTERIRAFRLKHQLACLPGERVANLSSLRFWNGLSRAVRCLADSGTVIAFPTPIKSNQVVDWIARTRIGYLSCTPRHVHDLLQGTPANTPPLALLRILRCSSAALPKSFLAKALRRLTPNIFLNYGTNEAGPIAVATPDMLAREPETVGALLPGIELQIVDGQNRPVRAGTVGEVRLRGPGILFTREDGWNYPGDSAVLDEEGLLFLKGRTDEVINYDGILIGPAEIESVLAQHPEVLDVAGFAVPSERKQDLPAAAVVLRYPVPMNELLSHCRARLGLRAPAIIIGVTAIPRNPMGKPLRTRLRAIAQNRRRRKVNPA